MLYHCQFPDCTYSTNIKTQIHEHHIVPRELNGSNKRYNKILLCPNHHSKIYIPEATKGIHTINGEDSIIICQWLKSTSGRALEYISKGETKYHFYN